MATAHVDTFARDHLPPPEALPEILLDQPFLQFPARLNCATELLDRHVAEGRLVALFPQWRTPAKTFFAVTTRARLGSAKVRAFNAFLAEILDEEHRPPLHRSVEVRPIGVR